MERQRERKLQDTGKRRSKNPTELKRSEMRRQRRNEVKTVAKITGKSHGVKHTKCRRNNGKCRKALTNRVSVKMP